MGDIIFCCQEGSKKTRIMYSANLSYQLVRKYLSKMLERGYLTKKEDIYYVTERGKILMAKVKRYRVLKEEYLNLYEELKSNHSRLH